MNRLIKISMFISVIFGLIVLTGLLILYRPVDFLFWKDDKSPKIKPNVILISLDTLRRDHLGVYGYNEETSPHIDRFAGEAGLFLKGYSQSTWTKPSHACMLTGQYSLTHQVISLKRKKNYKTIPLGIKTIAEVLQANNYYTFAITDSGYLAGKFGFNRGFDIYMDKKRRGIKENIAYFKKLRPRDQKPFFAFIHTYDMHGSYRGPDVPACDNKENYQGRFLHTIGKDRQFYDLYQPILRGETMPDVDDINFLVNNYNNCIKFVDKQLGQFFRYLKNENLWDNSLIILTSDHGERFIPIRQSGFPCNRNKVFIEHIGMTPVLVQVPLVVKRPFQKTGEVIKRNVAAGIDLFPTILEITGINTNILLPGHSLFDKENDKYVFFSKVDSGFGLIKDDYYILFKKQVDTALPMISENPFTFNKDHYEIDGMGVGLYLGNLLIKKRLQSINRINDHYLRGEKIKKEELDEDLIEQLKSLGYM